MADKLARPHIKIIKGKRDEYELNLKEQLGRGGFASVYKGKRLSDGEAVAIKQITKRFDYGNSEVEHMESLSRDHNNHYTVKILDHYSDNKRELFLILPFYKHGSLRDYIKKNGRLNTKIASGILLQLVSSLIYLHQKRGIMHRDLTSANVLIKDISGDSIDVLLSDFGLAKKVGNNIYAKQTTCGTAGFMPPTVKDGKYKIGDEVYSLGGILYNMLTARDPDPGREKEQIKSVSDGLARDLLTELWQSDPDKLPTLQDLEKSPFLNQYRSAIKRSSSLRHSLTLNIDCKHRILNDDGKCRKCGVFPKSRKNSHDSAYGSKPPSRNTLGTNTKDAASTRNGDRSRRPSKTPSVRSQKTDNERSEKEWPIPLFHYFRKSDKQQIDEYRLTSPKGRFTISEPNILFFEALFRDKKFVEYIFELRLKGGKQEIIVYIPMRKNQELPKLHDDIIREKKYIEIITRPSELGDKYAAYYSYILKAIGVFYSRNAKINFAYVDGNGKYTAKLM
uniref:Protein kinase domain-containing protein n=1 Tax=Panagrolaimus superbus TaxID=310955 RepID=A0A914YRD9_9BILA